MDNNELIGELSNKKENTILAVNNNNDNKITDLNNLSNNFSENIKDNAKKDDLKKIFLEEIFYQINTAKNYFFYIYFLKIKFTDSTKMCKRIFIILLKYIYNGLKK